MAYDILEIEAKRVAALNAVQSFLDAIETHPSARWYADWSLRAKNAGGYLGVPAYKLLGYKEELQDALASRESLSHPNDSPEPSPEWRSEGYRSKRFILKACDLWSDEYQEPTVTSPQTWEQVNLAADFITKYLKNPTYGSALTPDLFRKYYDQTSQSVLRPQYIPERFNDFLKWCRTKGYIA